MIQFPGERAYRAAVPSQHHQNLRVSGHCAFVGVRFHDCIAPEYGFGHMYRSIVKISWPLQEDTSQI